MNQNNRPNRAKAPKGKSTNRVQVKQAGVKNGKLKKTDKEWPGLAEGFLAFRMQFYITIVTGYRLKAIKLMVLFLESILRYHCSKFFAKNI